MVSRAPKPQAGRCRKETSANAGSEEGTEAGWQASLKARYRNGASGPTWPHLHRFKPRGFPLILDEYVLREFLKMFAMVFAGFVLMMLVFTFFELIGDILRNHTPLGYVGAYLLNLTPSMIYQITPLSVLIAVLVTFGSSTARAN
jgi:hypothetical protein